MAGLFFKAVTGMPHDRVSDDRKEGQEVKQNEMLLTIALPNNGGKQEKEAHDKPSPRNGKLEGYQRVP